MSPKPRGHWLAARQHGVDLSHPFLNPPDLPREHLAACLVFGRHRL
jgi:hypothetical protein